MTEHSMICFNFLCMNIVNIKPYLVLSSAPFMIDESLLIMEMIVQIVLIKKSYTWQQIIPYASLV